MQQYYPWIKVGKSWLQGISINTKQSVSVLSDVVIPPRSEQVITVHCNPNNALVVGEFCPKIRCVLEIYASRAQVFPNVKGYFQMLRDISKR